MWQALVGQHPQLIGGLNAAHSFYVRDLSTLPRGECMEKMGRRVWKASCACGSCA